MTQKLDFDVFMNDLIERDLIKCASCREILTGSVWEIQDVGNVCDNCNNKNYINSPSKPHNLLNFILSSLPLRCKFYSRGCNKRFLQDSLSQHEYSCSFQVKSCPMSFKLINYCRYEGHPRDLFSHFEQEHKDDVVNSADNTFSVNTELTGTIIYKLIMIRGNVLALKIVIAEDANLLYYGLCGVLNDFSVNYTVKHKSGIDSSLNRYITTRSVTCPPDNIYKDNISWMTSIDLGALKAIMGSDKIVKHSFKIKLGLSSKDQFEEIFMSHLECPVCKIYMRPPIQQCLSGHSLCSKCKPRLDKCPTCRSSFGSVRNYSLEALTAGIKYPCMYYEKGCLVTAGSEGLLTHEQICPFKPYKCPIANCHLTGNHDLITSHLTEFHDKLLIRGPIFQDKIRLDHHFSQMIEKKIILAFEQIFRISLKRTCDHCFWAAEVINGNNCSQEFIYEVKIVDGRKPLKTLIRTDQCLPDNLGEEIYNRAIMFPNSFLSSYAYNGVVNVHFTIAQNESLS